MYVNNHKLVNLDKMIHEDAKYGNHIDWRAQKGNHEKLIRPMSCVSHKVPWCLPCIPSNLGIMKFTYNWISIFPIYFEVECNMPYARCTSMNDSSSFNGSSICLITILVMNECEVFLSNKFIRPHV